MTDTIPNVTITQNTWTNIYSASLINVGTPLQIENIGSCDIYIAVQAATPEQDHDAYSVIQRENGLTLNIPAGASGVWAFCQGSDGKVNLTVGDNAVAVALQKTAFGELSVAEPTPVAQIVASRGTGDKVAEFVFSSGSTGNAGGLFESSSGTSADGLGSVVTSRQVTYRAGQGLLGRLTAVFDTPQANNIQHAGLITINDRFCFGYEGTDFGIVHVHDGMLEIQELTITTPAGGGENATVTVDGTGYTVPLTAGTVQHNAFQIQQSLNAQIDDYTFTSNDDTVVARSLLPTQGGGSFAFTSATAVAAWSQISAATVPITDFVAQDDWNVNTAPWLDPSKGNVYQVQMQYLGFGVIRFYVEDPDSGDELLVHVIKYPNSQVSPIVGDPTFRCGWLTINDGNTTPVTIKGASAALFVEGEVIPDEPTRADNNINLAVTNTELRNVITLRNRQVFLDRQNRYDVFGLSLALTSSSTKATFVEARINATLSGEPDFQYVDKSRSIVEVEKSNLIVTGGRLVASDVIPPGGSVKAGLKAISALLLAGYTVTISARVDSGANSEVSVGVVWQEDL